jgi:hypothetical protein
MKSAARVLLPVVLSVGLSGCIFGGGKPAKVVAPTQVPAPPVTASAPVPVPQPPPPVAEEVPSPEPPTEQIPLRTETAPTGPELKLPEPTPTPRRPQQTRTEPPKPEAPPEPAPVAVPQLTEILSSAQRSQMESELTDHLARARSALGKVPRVTLNASQRETYDRINTFILQAEQARANDPATALQLAKRADLLAQDLLPAGR